MNNHFVSFTKLKKHVPDKREYENFFNTYYPGYYNLGYAYAFNLDVVFGEIFLDKWNIRLIHKITKNISSPIVNYKIIENESPTNDIREKYQLIFGFDSTLNYHYYFQFDTWDKESIIWNNSTVLEPIDFWNYSLKFSHKEEPIDVEMREYSLQLII